MSFSKDIGDFNKNTKKASTAIFRGAALTIFGMVVKLTPVDKGTLRANWQVGINAPPKGKIGSTKRADVKGANNAKLGDTIYLVNNLDYAQKVEHGNYSTQAPNGMVKVAIASWEHVVNMKARSK